MVPRPAHSSFMLQAATQPIDSTRWNTIVERDRTAAGSFVYAVRSTGVYCRPSCPSRRPHRDRTAFFFTPADAERAGFRPCKRCRPRDQPATRSLDRKDPPRVRVSFERRRALTLSALASRIGGSPYHLQRTFKRIVGVTPRQYADACRLQHVKDSLRGKSVTDARLDAGYGSSSRFYERAAGKLGMTPSTYRRGGAGMSNQVLDCRLARRAAARGSDTARRVSRVDGTSDAELERALAREYPSATIARAPGGLARWTRHPRASGGTAAADRPAARRASDGVSVAGLEALAAIPYGETRTYADVAAAIGRPRAARAVARACATNPVALAIPCHRVVPATGGVGGYRWGRARKKALLATKRRRRGDGLNVD